MADRLPQGPAAGEWTKTNRLPPLHQQVLVLLKHGVGFVCDVACYAGKDVEGRDRWILADVFLDTTQITAWAHITVPGEAVWPWISATPD